MPAVNTPNNSRKAVLIVQNVIEHYRYEFYRALNKSTKYSFCGFYHFRRADGVDTVDFPTLEGRSSSIAGLVFQSGYWRAVARNDYEVVIAAFDLHILSNAMLLFFCKLKGVRFIWWGIGLGKRKFLHRLRAILAGLADGVIVYETSAAARMRMLGVNPGKVFVAHNTVHVSRPCVNLDASKRERFLFVGSLDSRKRLDLLLEAFSTIQADLPDHIGIDIVGDGPERKTLEEMSKQLGIQKRVIFHGKIIGEERLRPLFYRALLSVSPGQAGLSVLHSFANGVGFVSQRDAISGGEIENVEDGVTGFLYSGGIQELVCIMSRVARRPELAVQVGANAHKHYVEKRKMEQMANVFEQAITCVCERRPMNVHKK